MPKRRHWGLLSPMPAAMLGQVVRQAEALGLEGIWVPQLYGQPFGALAAAAMVSERLKLGSGVALAFTRSPLETALAAIDLDIISGGRAVLGLGTSLRWFNEQWHGVTYGKPLPHLREIVGAVRDIIANAHSGTLGRMEGDYHKLDLRWFKTLSNPVRDRIPIYLPAVFRSGIRMAGEIADGLVGHPIWSTQWIEREVVPSLDVGLRRTGRARKAFDFNVWLWVAINSDAGQAIEDARATVAFYASFTQYEKYFAAHGFGEQARAAYAAAQRSDNQAMAQAIPDEMVLTFAAAGTPEQVQQRVDRLWLKADSMTLAAPFYGMEPALVARYQTAIAEQFYR